MTNSSPSGIDGLKDARITYSPKLDTASYEAVINFINNFDDTRSVRLNSLPLWTKEEQTLCPFEFKRGLALAECIPRFRAS